MDPLQQFPALNYSIPDGSIGHLGNIELLQPLPDSFNFQGPTNSDLYRIDRCFQSQNLGPGYPVPFTAPENMENEIYQFPCNNLQGNTSFKIAPNPIANSPQYQAYRDRQNDRNPSDEKKWPSDLENYFLDAMIDIPPMGRQKYSFDGKPHGRNELIALYIWIAYTESLPPGVTPNPSMKRHRKQISSHIQVLKKFFLGHRVFSQIFPAVETNTRNTHSFENNPCLIALSQGSLPSMEYRYQVRYDHYRRLHQLDDVNNPNSHVSMRPVNFSLVGSSAIPGVNMHESYLHQYYDNRTSNHNAALIQINNGAFETIL